MVESAVLYRSTCPALRHEKMWFHPMTEEVDYVIPHKMSAAVILSPALCTFDAPTAVTATNFPSVHGDIAIIPPVCTIDITRNLTMLSECLIVFLEPIQSKAEEVSRRLLMCSDSRVHVCEIPQPA